VCEDTQRSIGAHVAFLIDNSNSNSVTDCPSPVERGTQLNSRLYQCGGATNRETAVQSALKLLQAVAAKEAGNEAARSRIAVASFPTETDIIDGWTIQTKANGANDGWLEATDTSASTLGQSLAFTRRPAGLTPYAGAFNAATRLFGGDANDGRAKVAVLVTDGEPTDADPDAVAAQAQTLREAGVTVITVFVTSEQTRANRIAQHRAMLESYDRSSRTNPSRRRPWYEQAYASFDDYFRKLVGGGGEPGLVASVSSPGEIVEVGQSAELEAAFQRIIRTKAIHCE
jgi:hypothetical protein